MSTQDNEEGIRELYESEKAFSRLLESGAFIHKDLKKAIDNALLGQPLPSASELNTYIQIDLIDVMENSKASTSQEALAQVGFILNDEQANDFKLSAWLIEELPHNAIRKKYGWGIPSEESISSILKVLEEAPGLLEIGAGSGLWSAIIKSRTDKEIIPCELNLRGDTPRPVFCEVQNIAGEKLIEQYPDYAVLIVWPDINDMSVKMARNLASGNKLIIAGPPSVTGNDLFYEYLDTYFNIDDIINTNKFSGTMDNMFILTKREEPNPLPSNYFTNLRTKDRIFKKKSTI